MSENIIALLAILLACIVFLKIAMEDASRIRSLQDFFLYCKELLPGKVFGTFYASGMSLATVFIAFYQLAPFLGTKLIWSVIFYPLGLFALWLAIPKISDATNNSGTIHGFLGNAFKSKEVTVISSIASCIGFIGVFATEIIIGSLLLRSVLPGEAGYWAALLLLSAVVLSYSILGGFKTVVRTDKWQSIMIILVCLILLLLATSSNTDPLKKFVVSRRIEDWILPAVMMINFFLINVPFQLVDMSAWQRIAASKDEASARRGLFTAIIMFVFTWGAILYSALILSSLYNQGDSTGGLAGSLLFLGNTGINGAILSAFCFAGLVSAMLSTADSFLIAAGQTISMDISDRNYFRSINAQGGGVLKVERKIIAKSRKAMLFIAFFGLASASVLTVIGFQAADLIFAVYGSSLALFPSVAYALFCKSSKVSSKLKYTAILSILSGITYGWFFGVFSVLNATKKINFHEVLETIDILPGDPSPYNAPTYAIGVAMLVFVLGRFIEPKIRSRMPVSTPKEI